MNHIFKIIELLEHSNVLTDDITKTVKQGIKKKQGDGFLPAFLAPFCRFVSATIDFFSSKRYKWKWN